MKMEHIQLWNNSFVCVLKTNIFDLLFENFGYLKVLFSEGTCALFKRATKCKGDCQEGVWRDYVEVSCSQKKAIKSCIAAGAGWRNLNKGQLSQSWVDLLLQKSKEEMLNTFDKVECFFELMLE